MRQLSRGSVLEFRSRDDTGQVLKYSVFSPPLQAMIKPEVELTLEIATSSRETPQGTFVNFKGVSANDQSGIRQIFKGRTDSPETRASIEAMKAADIASHQSKAVLAFLVKHHTKSHTFLRLILQGFFPDI